MSTLKLTDDLVQRILDAYQGVEQLDSTNRRQRVFLWEDGNEIRLGNTYAFAQFLEVSWSSVHKVLRDHGHALWSAPKVSRSELVGEFQEPAPFSTVVGHVRPVGVERTRRQVLLELAETVTRLGALFNELLDMEEPQ